MPLSNGGGERCSDHKLTWFHLEEARGSLTHRISMQALTGTHRGNMNVFRTSFTEEERETFFFKSNSSGGQKVLSQGS